MAVPKSRLERAPLRLWNDDTKLATQVEEPQVRDRFRGQFWVKTLFYPWVLPDDPKSPTKASANTAEDHLSPTQSERRMCHPRLATSHDPSYRRRPRKKEGLGVHRTPSQASPSENQDNSSNTANPSLPETPSESQGLPSPPSATQTAPKHHHRLGQQLFAASYSPLPWYAESS